MLFRSAASRFVRTETGVYSVSGTAAEVANRWQHVLWNHGGASEAIYRGGLTWVVGILSPPSTYFHSVIDYARQTLPTVGDVAVVHSTAGAFPRDIAAGAVQHCQQHGMATQRYPYPAGTRDFTPLLHTLAHARPTVVLSVGRMDDVVDQLYEQIYADLLQIMAGDPSTIEPATHLLWCAHNLERIGDRATNIAERTVYAATGMMPQMDVSSY